MRLRNEGRLSADLDGSILVFTHDAEEFHDVAKVLGEANIEGPDILNTANIDLFRIDGKSMGKCSQQDCLVGCIPSVDIKGFVKLGITQFLGFLERIGIIELSLSHPHQDIIGSPIDNSRY